MPRISDPRARLLLIVGILAALLGARCALNKKKQGDAAGSSSTRMDWWRSARFGMFIHWGLYAIPAGEWGDDKGHGEWIMNTAHIPVPEYEKFRERFNPAKFDADEWVSLAKSAGMGYVVITSKHHDGFCLFDSKYTDYDVMSTPFHRDIMKEMAEACRKEGLVICWYHSIMDWHHPDYVPRRDWETRPATGANFDRYFGHLENQVSELLTNYGNIGVLWFDGEWESTWSHAYGQQLYELCRGLQPNLIVNNRVDVGREGMAGSTAAGEFAGDFGTPEQEIPAQGLPGVDWETCMTMNDHWGYNKNDQNFKTTEDLIRKLCDIASKGGNFLLNVGPTAEGLIPPTSVERLREIGKWMAVNGDSIHGSTASPLPALPWGRVTMKRDGAQTILYLHVFDWPTDGKLALPGIGNEPLRARLLAAPNMPLAVERIESDLRITVPKNMPDPLCSVVELEVKGAPIVYQTPTISSPSDIFVRPIDVAIDGNTNEVEIRYTLDGTEPTLESPLARGSVRIAETAVVKARAFHRGKPVSGIAERKITKVGLSTAKSIEARDPMPGLVSVRYDGDWRSLPNFNALRAISFTTIPNFHWSEGDVEFFGRRFRGWITVPDGDVYVFSLASDDGSRLEINDAVIIDNDGLHPTIEKRGFAALGAGSHKIRLDYFNRTGGKELRLRCAAVGQEPREIPDRWLRHLADDLPELANKPSTLADGIVCEIYPGSYDKLPDFDSLTPTSTTTVPNFGIEPGNPSNTARRFRGFINIPADEVYTIALASDDGSRLRIDGKLVIDHDGLHPLEEKRTSLTLAAGVHPIVVEYFNRGGGAELTLKMGKGTDRLAPINDSWLLH